MIKILTLLESLGFIVEENGIYIGYGVNNENTEELISFEFKSHYLICKEGSKILFSIIYADIEIGTLLVLLHHYGIIQERFIYKSIEKIEEAFNNK